MVGNWVTSGLEKQNQHEFFFFKCTFQNNPGIYSARQLQSTINTSQQSFSPAHKPSTLQASWQL